jgi:hypothetical protein
MLTGVAKPALKEKIGSSKSRKTARRPESRSADFIFGSTGID